MYLTIRYMIRYAIRYIRVMIYYMYSDLITFSRCFCDCSMLTFSRCFCDCPTLPTTNKKSPFWNKEQLMEGGRKVYNLFHSAIVLESLQIPLSLYQIKKN